MVAVVEPGKLDLSLDKTSVALTPGKTIEVPFEISRGKNLDGPVSVELVLPPHIKGLSAETARIPKKEAHGRLQIRCANPLPGPVNMPLLLRATLMHEGRPIVAEARVEAVLSD